MAKMKNPKLVRFSNDTFGIRVKSDTGDVYLSQGGATMQMPVDPESLDWDNFETLYMMQEKDARAILEVTRTVDDKVIRRKNLKVEVIE